MTTHTDLIARLRAYPTRDGVEAVDALESLEQQVAALTEYNKTRTDELMAAGRQVAALQSQMYEDRKQALTWRDQVAALKVENHNYQIAVVEKNLKIDALTKERDEREGLVCDQCIDGSGWCENADEGRYPCTCMTEAEPYQLLLDQLDAAQAREAKLREALEAVGRNNISLQSLAIINKALANPATILELCALLEKAEEALERMCIVTTSGAENGMLNMGSLEGRTTFYDLLRTEKVTATEAIAAIKQWKEQT